MSMAYSEDRKRKPRERGEGYGELRKRGWRSDPPRTYDDLEMDEPTEVPLRYLYDRRGWELIAQTTDLLRKVAASPALEPLDLISVAKALQVLEDMPRVPPIDGSLNVTVVFPETRHGDVTTCFYLSFDMQDGDIILNYAGHTYDPAVGGDSFNCWRLQLWAGEEADFLEDMDRCLPVPGVVGLAGAIDDVDFTARVDLDVVDDEDPFREAYLGG